MLLQNLLRGGNMQTQTAPGWLTLSERVSEVAAILAAGIMRTRLREIARIRKTRSFSEKGLDFSLDSSVHSMKPSARSILLA